MTEVLTQASENRESTLFLVEKARSGLQDELRQSRRFPFFQPVTVHAADGSANLSAFSRDVSAWGIGLLMNFPLNQQEVRLTIHFTDKENVDVRGIVRWCQPCGQGWYLAGISFQNGGDELGYMIGGCAG
jgi:hypothetical protein